MASGAIYSYRVAADGGLQMGNAGNPVVQVSQPVRMMIDWSGKWLFVASANTPQLQEFRVDAAKGTLQPASPSTIALSAGTPAQIYLSPDNRNLFVALGRGGVDTFSFDANSGAAGARLHTATLPTANSHDNALTSDSKSKFLFVAEKGSGIRVLRIVADGVLQEISGSPFLPQGSPSSLAVGPADQHLFVADHQSNSMRELLIGRSGSLTPVSSTAFDAAASPTALALVGPGGDVVSVSTSGTPSVQTAYTGGTARMVQ